MKHISENIFFGICFKNTIVRNDSKCTKPLNGGFYGLCNDGDAYSHHDSEQNCQSTKFRCGSGDIVNIDVDM